MNIQLIICLIIFVLTIIGFLVPLERFPMWAVSVLAMSLLVLTKCVTASEALANFSNSTLILIASMFVLSSAFSRSRIIQNDLAKFIVKITKGSFTKAWVGYVILDFLLTNLTSPVVSFSIVFPLVAILCSTFNKSPSTVMFPLGVVSVSTFGSLPLSSAITATAQMNVFIDSYGIEGVAEINAGDLSLAKLGFTIIVLIWAAFFAPKMCEKKGDLPIEDMGGKNIEDDGVRTKKDVIPVFLFVIGVFGLVFSRTLGIDNWTIIVIADVLLLITGCMTSKEALAAMNVPQYLLCVGCLSLATALVATGGGDLIGEWISGVLGGTQNTFILYTVFFILPFLLTQVMLNQNVNNIFTPIALMTCKALGADPTGSLLLINAACLSAFLSPMATTTIPMMMAAGGYSQRQLLKQGWLISILICAGAILWVSIMFPAF